MAVATINALRAAKGEGALTLEQMHQQQLIRYIPFPDALRGKYQSYTQADIGAMREIGYAEPFLNVEQGVARYVQTDAASGRLATPRPLANDILPAYALHAATRLSIATRRAAFCWSARSASATCCWRRRWRAR